LVSQNRASKVDQLRSEVDLQVDLTTERGIIKILKLLKISLEKTGVDLEEDFNDDDVQIFYDASFPGDSGKPSNQFSELGEVYNAARQENLINKIKKIESDGGVVLAAPGATHVWNLKPVLENNRKTGRAIRATFYREEKSPERWNQKRPKREISIPDGSGQIQERLVFNRKDKTKEKKNRKDQSHGIYIREVQNSPASGRVIPENKDFVNKTAVKILEIERQTSSDIQTRSQGYRPKLTNVNKENSIWTFRVGDYKVKVKADFGQTDSDFSTADVKVVCECSFWQFQGPEYWARKKEYLFGQPKGTASKPMVKDPKGDHRCCKHVAAVFRVLKQL